jgi:cytochrome c oxidase assembly factor CtaG
MFKLYWDLLCVIAPPLLVFAVPMLIWMLIEPILERRKNERGH